MDALERRFEFRESFLAVPLHAVLTRLLSEIADGSAREDLLQTPAELLHHGARHRVDQVERRPAALARLAQTIVAAVARAHE